MRREASFVDSDDLVLLRIVVILNEREDRSSEIRFEVDHRSSLVFEPGRELVSERRRMMIENSLRSEPGERNRSVGEEIERLVFEHVVEVPLRENQISNADGEGNSRRTPG